MALAATTIWELRTTGAASNLCGGGFNPANTGNSGGPGTDYSQQNSPQYHFTDLASANGTSSTPSVTSASHSFVGADCGNLLYISAGTNWTTGWYEIVSVSGGAAVLDRACGTSATLSSGTWYVGGALSDGTISPLGNTGAVAGNTVYVKSGTWTPSANWNWSSQIMGTSTGTIQGQVIGYQATRGDNPTGSNRPQVNFGSGAVFLTGSYCTWANLCFKSAHANSSEGTAFINGGHGQVFNCKFVNTYTGATNIPAFGTQNNLLFVGCEFVSYFGYGYNLTTNNIVTFLNCWFHDSPYGIWTNYTGAAVNLNAAGCTFSGCTQASINLSSGGSFYVALFLNNTFFGGISVPIGIGLNIPGTYGKIFSVLNSVFYGLVTGMVADSGDYENYNNYYNNTTDVSGITKGPNSIALNPGFLNVGQYVNQGTVTSSGSVMTDTGAAFTNVVPGRDYLYVSAMTGGSGAGIYGITANTSTTITTDNSLGTGSAITYSIIYGQNFAVGANMANAGNSNLGNPNMTSYVDIGGAQVQYTNPATTNVKNGTTYIYQNVTETGTYQPTLAATWCE